MATWPIRFSKGARPGKWPHLLDVQTNDDKWRLYEKDDETIEEFQFEQTETENCFYVTKLQQKNKIIKFDINKIVLKIFYGIINVIQERSTEHISIVEPTIS